MNCCNLCQRKDFKFMRNYLLLYIGILVYSFCSIMDKLASMYPFMSLRFCLFYGCGLLFLALYAVIWQQVLKCLPLTTAYANRPLAMLFCLLWGKLLFNEVITWNMLLGAIIILLGIRMVGKADEL